MPKQLKMVENNTLKEKTGQEEEKLEGKKENAANKKKWMKRI